VSENWSAQVSIKTPAGTLINLRGERGEQVEAQLAWITGVAPAIVAAEAAFAGVATVAQSFPGAQVVQQDGPSWSQQGSQQAAPQAAPAQPAGKTCVHGPMVYREGNGAKGPWKAYFCPLPQARKAEQCQPEFLR